MKTIGIAGGSGFIGRHLAPLLAGEGYKVIIFTRGTVKTAGNIRHARWNPDRQSIDTDELKEVDVMINLAGAGVADHRWTPAYKQEILRSRVDATSFLQDALRQHAPQCSVYIATSATGYYGPDEAGKPPFRETDPPYSDFLGEVCRQWEAATLKGADAWRTVILRLGIVLGPDGGAYPKLADPMKLGVMPIIGGGGQMVSWIHVADISRMLLLAATDTGISGIYNAVSPAPVSHKNMMQAIAAAKGGLKIPVPVPGFALKLIMGESSIEVLKSCTASAGKIAGAGFQFQYPNIRMAAAQLATD